MSVLLPMYAVSVKGSLFVVSLLCGRSKLGFHRTELPIGWLVGFKIIHMFYKQIIIDSCKKQYRSFLQILNFPPNGDILPNCGAIS